MSNDAPNEKEQLQTEARNLGIDVNDEWDAPVLKRKITMARNAKEDFGGKGDHDNDGKAGGAKDAKLVPMLLKRNYVPMGHFDIVGHHRKEVTEKNASGQIIVKSPAVFVEGEMAPPPMPGVGSDNKVWSGTTVRLPIEEAKRAKDLGIAERSFDD
ncbi:hypothetical protein [Pelagibacterium luteolum]|uniref:Uncharacterized protein n=1 Tax=Pelagibacterium luteolum TaxID=440168 RepID=A0A1G7TH45_9HYPH|nr:hypothetical protein [Pelagibacterium luteolum]SDG34638.1 hypothetical protein SAMN04487974_102127 [Pelagibacterium luteolum]